MHDLAVHLPRALHRAVIRTNWLGFVSDSLATLASSRPILSVSELEGESEARSQAAGSGGGAVWIGIRALHWHARKESEPDGMA